jgi:hypothetical protein
VNVCADIWGRGHEIVPTSNLYCCKCNFEMLVWTHLQSNGIGYLQLPKPTLYSLMIIHGRTRFYSSQSPSDNLCNSPVRRSINHLLSTNYCLLRFTCSIFLKAMHYFVFFEHTRDLCIFVRDHHNHTITIASTSKLWDLANCCKHTKLIQGTIFQSPNGS